MSKKVREVALDSLLHIEKNQSYSNLLLNQMIEKHQMDRRDVGLLTEIVYGTIQRKFTLEFYLAPFIKKAKKIESWVAILLQLSLYQIVYLDRVPDRAIIYEAVEIAKKRGHKGISSLVNGVLRNILRSGLPSFEQISDPLERLSIETSHPLWLVTKWAAQYGFEATKEMCLINLTAPPITARVNKVNTTVEGAINSLLDEGIKAEKGDLSEDAIKLSGKNIAHTNAFKNGNITIQDESSMLVGKAVALEEGQRVLDCCAAPGGKSTHMGEELKNTGEIVSMDLHPHKIKLIEEQVKRLHLTNIETKVGDSRKVHEMFEAESFDRILVDAPCSGFGVIRRKPDIKYSKIAEDIDKLASIQLQILTSAQKLLRKGGLLVYSTCTVDKEENDDVVEKFLKTHQNFEIDVSFLERMPKKLHPYINHGCVQILPHYFGTDGFFIATFRKKV
jgi:16S rRNA (cytosine967-C5)-methyltransferase